jgi:hypothetical protein
VSGVVSGASSGAASARIAHLPGLGAAVRASLSDYYFNSIRLVGANVGWGVMVVALILLALVSPLLALLLSPLLAIPTAAIFRITGGLVRGQTAGGRVTILPRSAGQVAREVALGTAFVMTTVVLGANLISGIGSGETVGVVVATMAGWGLVGLWCFALVVWPLLGDPNCAGAPIRTTLSVAATLLLVQPARVAALAVVVFVLTALSVVLMVALMTGSLSFIALVACRSVYAAADRLHGELGAAQP